jgi:dTDP-4-dehydrorhamnose reductase
VTDQLGNPKLADDLAFGIIRGIELGKTGIYNIAGREILSRFDFATHLARIFEFDAKLILPVKTSQLRLPAPRPLKSGLVTLKAEVELGTKPSTVEQGILVLKNQLARTLRRMADTMAVPGSAAFRQGKR